MNRVQSIQMTSHDSLHSSEHYLLGRCPGITYCIRAVRPLVQSKPTITMLKATDQPTL